MFVFLLQPHYLIFETFHGIQSESLSSLLSINVPSGEPTFLHNWCWMLISRCLQDKISQREGPRFAEKTNWILELTESFGSYDFIPKRMFFYSWLPRLIILDHHDQNECEFRARKKVCSFHQYHYESFIKLRKVGRKYYFQYTLNVCMFIFKCLPFV